MKYRNKRKDNTEDRKGSVDKRNQPIVWDLFWCKSTCMINMVVAFFQLANHYRFFFPNQEEKVSKKDQSSTKMAGYKVYNMISLN